MRDSVQYFRSGCARLVEVLEEPTQQQALKPSAANLSNDLQVIVFSCCAFLCSSRRNNGPFGADDMIARRGQTTAQYGKEYRMCL